MGICEKFVKGLSEYFLSLTQVRDDLVTDDSSQVLSARQGVVLRELVESNILAKLQFKVVMVLPEMGDSGVIYLTNKQSINDSEVYDQYVFIDEWVLLGSTVINLSDYYTKSETNNQINAHHDDTKQDKSTLNEDVESLGYLKEHQNLDNYYTKTQTNTQIANYHDPTKVDKITGKTLSTNDYTTAEKDKLASLNNYDDTNIQANIQNLNNNKADKSELNNYKDIFYCSCSTSANVSEKVITTDDDFELRKGVIIIYKPSATNTASNVTLNVNNTGAKQIWVKWEVFNGSGNLFTGYKDVPVYYIYDGTYWVWIGASNDNDTTTGTETTIEPGVNDTKFATRQSVRNYVDNYHDSTKVDVSQTVTMTVTFEDDTTKTYIIYGEEN